MTVGTSHASVIAEIVFIVMHTNNTYFISENCVVLNTLTEIITTMLFLFRYLLC